MKKKTIGIDLGTHQSELSHITESGVCEVIPNQDGDIKTPSIVSWAGEAPIVGKAAAPDLFLAPKFVQQCGKRSMGKQTEQGKPIPIGVDSSGQERTAVDFSAAILAYLRQSAEIYLGVEVSCAVITVPAYFDSAARADTKDAAKIAGFKEIKLLSEPEAAAIHYGLEKAANQTMVVVDTGGGTTDVTAIEVAGGHIRTSLTDGDAELGGLNYDEVNLDLMRKKAKGKGIEISPEKDLVTFYQNLDKAREAKEMLSRREEVTVIVEAKGKRLQVKLTRKILRREAKALDDRLVACCQRLFDGMKAQNKSAQHVVLVGGNSRQAHIAELVKGVFGLEVAKDTDPDLVVAKGAAVYSKIHFGDKDTEIVIGGHRYLAADIKVQTVAAHPLCVSARKSKNDPREYNCVIVPSATALPHEFEERFSPVNPTQSEVIVKIVQGKPDSPSSDAVVLREIRVPIQPSECDTDRIRVKGHYTTEGLLELTVMDSLLGKTISDSFIHKSGLTSAEIEQKQRQMKTHSGGSRS